MTGIIPYTFEGRSISVITDEAGEPWFVAKEVAAVLGYSEASAMTRSLDDDEKGLQDLQTLGGRQKVAVINESGLYSAILRSERPEAKPFKRWVNHDVLPSIRRTGGYGHARSHELVINVQAAKAFPAFYDVARLIGCDQNAAAISANQYVLKLSQVNLMAGLGRIHLEALSQQDQYFTPTELGKRRMLSGRKMNQLLQQAGLQTKHGNAWELTETGRQFGRIYDTGKRHGSGVPVSQVKWSSAVLEKIAAH